MKPECTSFGQYQESIFQYRQPGLLDDLQQPAGPGASLPRAASRSSSGMAEVNYSSDSEIDESSGLLTATVLTDVRMIFPLVLNAQGAVVSGEWDTTWNPPSP
jgi:hypothetical protein